jgi:hypothetical protein
MEPKVRKTVLGPQIQADFDRREICTKWGRTISSAAVFIFSFSHHSVCFVGNPIPARRSENKKENAPAAEPPERFETYFAALADFRAQEAAVIFDSHSAAAE